MSDHYSTLGIQKNASADEIKKAYRKKAKLYHPDVSKLPNAEELFRKATIAYDILSNPVTRARYDAGTLNKSTSKKTSNYQKRSQHTDKRHYRRSQEKARSYSRMKYKKVEQELWDNKWQFYIPRLSGLLAIILIYILFLLIVIYITQDPDDDGLSPYVGIFVFFTVISIPIVSTYFDLWLDKKRREKIYNDKSKKK